MYYNEALVQKMEACAFDMNNEYLVTDLVHELSSGIKIPFHLEENIITADKSENVCQLENMCYEDPLKESWREDSYFSFANNCENTFFVNNIINNDFPIFLQRNNIESTQLVSGFSGSCSGSDSSSTEFMTTKIELDTPPVTPPDERTASDNVFLLPSDELKFIPVCMEENSHAENKIKSDCKNVTKPIKIQPKPVSTTLNIFDSQPLNYQTVMCNVFSDNNLCSVRNQDNTVDSKLFLNSNDGKRKSLLTKKDLELLQVRKKQERMIRNRESAYLSRKRKKEHVTHLEKQVQDLQAENKQLKLENSRLRQRLSKFEDLEPIAGKKQGNLFTDSPRKTTALLALLFTVCLNVGSFSSLINEKRLHKSNNDIVEENVVLNYPKDLRHTRSLLWAENDLGTLNSTYANLTKISCPLFVNQTESIRLESELRRWIGGDEEHLNKAKYNTSKTSQYYNLKERTFLNKNVLKQKQRPLKSSFPKKNLEMDMYQMNVLNFNTFFEAIHRRDDTFYLVSFSSDHLLLPALSHNQTSRPKMSLMLPAYFSNGTEADQVELMQIDCEVTNTQLLSVNENDIPTQIRPYTNSTSRSKSKFKGKVKKFEEYFMSDIPVTLVPAAKINFKTEKNDLNYVNSSKNSSNLFFNSLKNTSKSSDFEALNFNLSHMKEYEDKNSQYFQYKGNVFSNHTYKQDQNAAGFMSNNGRNSLKLLMLEPTVADPKTVKYNNEKSVYKAFQNATKFLLN